MSAEVDDDKIISINYGRLLYGNRLGLYSSWGWVVLEIILKNAVFISLCVLFRSYLDFASMDDKWVVLLTYLGFRAAYLYTATQINAKTGRVVIAFSPAQVYTGLFKGQYSFLFDYQIGIIVQILVGGYVHYMVDGTTTTLFDFIFAYNYTCNPLMILHGVIVGFFASSLKSQKNDVWSTVSVYMAAFIIPSVIGSTGLVFGGFYFLPFHVSPGNAVMHDVVGGFIGMCLYLIFRCVGIGLGTIKIM